MARCLPVVVTAVGGIPDVVVSGRNGILVSPGDVSELANALVVLLQNPQMRSDLGAQAHDTVKRKYGIEHVCGLLSTVYCEVAAGHRFRASAPRSLSSIGDSQ